MSVSGREPSAPAADSSLRTPVQCPYRRALRRPLNNAHHSCGLLSSLAGSSDETLFPVRLDECELCCNSQVPSSSGLNGITASTFYKGLQRIKEAGGVEGCDAAKAERLIPWARRFFTVICMRDIMAARGNTPAYNGPCAHLGEHTSERLCKTCRGKVWLKVFQCRHPRHTDTVIRECMVCPDYTLIATPS
jgi:hypothetical protein